MSVARRERKYGGPESDRTKRVLSQPVQAWERKWTESARGNHIQVCKWVKSDREIEFEDDEEEEEEDEEEEMDTEKEQATTTEMETSTAATPEVATQLEPELTAEGQKTELPASTGILNAAVDKKLAQLEDEEQTHTPKLDDVSDHEPEPETSTDIETDNPAAYPASNPHIQARLEETDSLDTTPQGTQDEEMEDASGIDTTYQSNTATPEYTSFRTDRAREVLDAAVSDGTPMEPSISQSSMNDETPASSEPYDE